MADFNVRSDSVNVEQIMEQIRSRIRDKRGVDYTEQQIHELAAVKLEKFLDPKGIRSDLLDQFRRAQPAYEPPELPNYAFEENTLFESHRAPIRWLRKLLAPLLKLLFNPNPLIQALNIQARLNTMNAERDARREAARRGLDQLYYELIHNLVLEATRTGIEVKNLKMRLESVSSRLEFNERRSRALEEAVVYKAAAEDPAPVATQRAAAPVPYQQSRAPQPSNYARPNPQPSAPPAPAVSAATTQAPTGAPVSAGAGPATEGPGQRSRRRRRRRGRRGGATSANVAGPDGMPGAGVQASGSPADSSATAGDYEGPDEDGDDPTDDEVMMGASAADKGAGSSALEDAPARGSHDLLENFEQPAPGGAKPNPALPVTSASTAGSTLSVQESTHPAQAAPAVSADASGKSTSDPELHRPDADPQ